MFTFLYIVWLLFVIFIFQLEFAFDSCSMRDNLILNLFNMYSQYLARIVSCVDISWLQSSLTFSSNCFGSSSLLVSFQSSRFSWYKSTKNANKNGDRTPDTYSSSQKSTTCWRYRKKWVKNSIISFELFKRFMHLSQRKCALFGVKLCW